MSVASTDKPKRITTHVLQEMKVRGEKISMLTAYDYSMAKIIDRAGIDVILVGDSASNVMAGYETTIPITLNEMIYHASSVCTGCGKITGYGRYAFRFLPGKFKRSTELSHPNYEGNRCPWR